MLAQLNLKVNRTPVAANPYTQAVAAGWIGAGTGADQVITQLQFDHGVVRILGLQPTAKALSGLHTVRRAGVRRCRSASASSRWCGPWAPA